MSNEIQSSHSFGPKGQYPSRSLASAKVITRAPTHRSAMANETMKLLPRRRSRRSEATATHTNRLPKMDTKMTSVRSRPNVSFNINEADKVVVLVVVVVEGVESDSSVHVSFHPMLTSLVFILLVAGAAHSHHSMAHTLSVCLSGAD